MVEVLTNKCTSKLEICNYDGNSGETSRHPSVLKESSEKLNFFREKDNHAYIIGKITYQGKCRNNLIISPYEINSLRDVENALIFVDSDKIEISPIPTLFNYLEENEKLLIGNINYHIPKRVFIREDLPNISLDKLNDVLIRTYGINPANISNLGGGRSQRGVYLIGDKTNMKFIFKFRGEDKNKSELISKILNQVPEYFPRIYPRVDEPSSHTIEIKGHSFGLEEFIEKSEQKIINLEYFSLFGEHLGTFHNKLSFVSSKDSALERELTHGESFNESSILSLYIDLINSDKKRHELLLKSLKGIVSRDFSNKMNKLPSSLIHKDLNSSNVLWIGDHPRMIDSESLGFYKRINEFVAPLLLGGNMGRPNYLRSSLQNLVESYESTINENLSSKEIGALPDLLRHSLLRFYVVRSIRRGIKDKEYLQVLENNLKNISDKND